MKMDRFLNILLVLGGLAIPLILFAPMLPVVFQMVGLLGVGWLALLGRVGPDVPVHRGIVLAGLVSLAVFGVAAQWFFGWMMRQMRSSASPLVWKRRWTASLVVGVGALVVGGIAAAGGASQFGRMVTSEEGWLRSNHGHRRSRLLQSASNLRQIGIGLSSYNYRYKELPPGATFDVDGTPLHGWPTLILPYVDNIELYNSINLTKPWNDSTNQKLTSEPIGIYKNPGVWDLGDEVRHTAFGYASNAWVIGGDKPRRLNEITDGLAQTLLGGEAAGNYKLWGSPIHWRDPNLGINRSASGFGGPFPGGANFLFCDGSVKFLRNQTPMALFRALATPDGGDRVDVDKLD